MNHPSFSPSAVAMTRDILNVESLPSIRVPQTQPLLLVVFSVTVSATLQRPVGHWPVGVAGIDMLSAGLVSFVQSAYSSYFELIFSRDRMKNG